MSQKYIIEEVEKLYTIYSLKAFRKTKGVTFDAVPMDSVLPIDAIDRVIHEYGALSPGSVEGVQKPWYLHQNQVDHLMVLAGSREIELYTPAHNSIVHLTLTANEVLKNGKLLYEGAAIVMWPTHVYHRIKSSDEFGSASINFATRTPGFDIKTNFNIYDVNTTTATATVIRDGYLDQM